MKNYTKVDVGPWKSLTQQVFEMGALRKEGKRFIGEEAKTTGCEISFNRLEAGDGYPFLHKHASNEEVYIAIGGSGEMLVDGEVVAMNEGTVIRVSPDGVRSIRAAADSSMDYLCVQAKENTIDQHGPLDGELVAGDVVWR